MTRLFVRIASWHIQGTYTRDGGMITRCGLRVRPPLTTAQGPDAPGYLCGNCRSFTKMRKGL